VYLDFLALLRSTGLLCALLSLFGLAPFDPVDCEFDAGGCVLGGGVGDGGGRHLFVTTLGGTALASYKASTKQSRQIQLYRQDGEYISPREDKRRRTGDIFGFPVLAFLSIPPVQSPANKKGNRTHHHINGP